jgi:hypothetical protein
MIAEESSDLTRKIVSFRFWIFVVVCAYFGLALYWAYTGLTFSVGLISDQYVYQLLMKGPWWWTILYYASEGIFNQVAVVVRAVAGVFAFYSAFLFLWKKERALPLIKGKVSTALLLEGVFFLSFLAAAIAAFAYNTTSYPLYYFDHTPGLILLSVTGIPCLIMGIIIPAFLFKLRSKIMRGSLSQDIIKWSCLTGLSYLFVAFWFTYAMAWLGNMIPYSRSKGQYGFSFLLEPVNLACFMLTVFGLFVLAMYGLMSTLPAIKKLPNRLSLRRIGVTMAALGGYFVFILFYYYLTGTYSAHPNVWYEIIGPLHNLDLIWCITFLFLGLALITSHKSRG